MKKIPLNIQDRLFFKKAQSDPRSTAKANNFAQNGFNWRVIFSRAAITKQFNPNRRHFSSVKGLTGTF